MEVAFLLDFFEPHRALASFSFMRPVPVILRAVAILFFVCAADLRVLGAAEGAASSGIGFPVSFEYSSRLIRPEPVAFISSLGFFGMG